jgi:hypothetical protein
MSQPLIEGPGPPESVPSPPKRRVSGLVPFVHVEDVERSIAFYYHLGFIVASIYRYRGTSVWAELRSEGAELMVSTDGARSTQPAKECCSTCIRTTWPRCESNCSPTGSMSARSSTAHLGRARRCGSLTLMVTC